MKKPAVFVVSADAAVRDSIKELVESANLQAKTFTSLQTVLDALGSQHRGCLVLNVQTSDLIDPEWQARLAAACALMPSILITDRGDVPTAVYAVKAGASDVLQKPYRDQNLLSSIRRALQADAVAHG